MCACTSLCVHPRVYPDVCILVCILMYVLLSLHPCVYTSLYMHPCVCPCILLCVCILVSTLPCVCIRCICNPATPCILLLSPPLLTVFSQNTWRRPGLPSMLYSFLYQTCALLAFASFLHRAQFALRLIFRKVPWLCTLCQQLYPSFHLF